MAAFNDAAPLGAPSGVDRCVSGSEPFAPRDLRLPVLKRPPGWSLLDESAVRVRATSLFHACVPHAQVRDAASPGQSQALAMPPMRSLEDTLRESASASMPHRKALVGPSPVGASAQWQAAKPDEPRRIARTLPWLLATVGLLVITPWLVWAPLAGGLCLGILLLQTGLLRHWLAGQREVLANQAATDDGAPVLASTPESARPRWAHSGWLLTAVLVLVGVQAAMLFATVQIRRDTASMQRDASAYPDTLRPAHRATERPTEEGALLPVPVPGAPVVPPNAGAARRDPSVEASR